MKSQWFVVLCLLTFILTLDSCKKSSDVLTPGALHLAYTRIGQVYLSVDTPNTGLPVDSAVIISFNEMIDTGTVRTGVSLKKSDQSLVACNITFSNNFTSVRLLPKVPLEHANQYTLQLSSGIKGAQAETFPGVSYSFTTVNGKMRLESISLNGINFMGPAVPYNIDFNTVNIQVRFSEALDSSNYKSEFYLSGGLPLGFNLSSDRKSLTISNGSKLTDIKSR